MMNLTEFTAAVNALQKREVDKLNADSKRLFGASFHPYSAKMVEYYYSQGLTASETLEEINCHCEAEGRAEAYGS